MATVCILPKKLRSEKEYNVIISLSICSETENSCFMQSIDHLSCLLAAGCLLAALPAGRAKAAAGQATQQEVVDSEQLAA